MFISTGTLPGSPDRPNEDWVAATPTTVIVLDGVSPPATKGHGCRHSVPWFVRSLGTWFLTLLETGDGDMTSALADAIDQVADLHRDTCDLSHPGTPAATVAAIRQEGNMLEWLVLADTTIALDTGASIQIISDARVDGAVTEDRERVLKQRIGTPGHKAALAHMSREQLKRRNVPGGYWVAAADRQAAREAVTGSIGADRVRRAVVYTDGAAGLFPTELSPADWKHTLDQLWLNGIEMSLCTVRRIENLDPEGIRFPRYKKSDDATLATIEMEMSADQFSIWTNGPTVSDESYR